VTEQLIHLGYEVGSGQEVKIPLAHTFVTGQTQLSGKTTTLQAIVSRAGRPAVAFMTKRGETLSGNPILPFLPRQHERPIHWRLVETILAATLGQKTMKYERLWLINAAKGAKSLEDVRRNVERLKKKAKGGSADVYELLGEYLDLVLPEMQQLRATDTLRLSAGLNVMDLAQASSQLQALVIRATLEHVNLHCKGMLTVFPEAWEFAPRSRNAPAKDEAIAMARKGAVLENFLLCDSQDIAGVETTIRQAASVWILGVQRELNELKRTLASIPAGLKKPKADEVATLDKGEFFACWGRHAIKTYVQPIWMDAAEAQAIARGHQQRTHPPVPEVPQVSPEEAKVLREENQQLRQQNRELSKQVGDLLARVERWEPKPESGKLPTVETVPPLLPQSDSGLGSTAFFGDGDAALYQKILDRLLQEPKILRLTQAQTRIEVLETVERIEVDGKTLRGRLARLFLEGFFDEPTTTGQVSQELTRRGFPNAAVNVSKELKELAGMGFLTLDNKWWKVVPGAKDNVIHTRQ
jgi:hypothetical protein